MPCIYKVENLVNHKVYIGKTLYSIEKRWSQHESNANRPGLWHMPLYSAIRKYGIENFSVDEVEYVESSSELSEREKYWISYYNSFNEGYNATLGGDGSLLYDYDMIWSYWEAGHTIKEISKIMNCNDFTVRTVLDEHGITTEERVARSYESQLISHKPYRRAVECIDVLTGDVLSEYESVSDAAKAIHIDDSSLSKICKKYPQDKPVRGFLWRYKDCDYVKKDFRAKQVCQIDLQTGEVLHVYPSVSDAARAVNGDPSYISKVCRHIQKSSKGYAWKYLCETDAS